MQEFFIFLVVVFGGMAVILILILTTLYKAIQFTLTATNLYKKIIIREDIVIKLLVDIRDNTKSIKAEDINKLTEEANDHIREFVDLTAEQRALMQQYNISYDGTRFMFQNSKYNKLEDAVKDAKFAASA